MSEDNPNEIRIMVHPAGPGYLQISKVYAYPKDGTTLIDALGHRAMANFISDLKSAGFKIDDSDLDFTVLKHR